MTKERFWQQMQAEYPNQSFIGCWWDRFSLEIWWSVDKNRKFVEDIQDSDECYAIVRKGKVINCICGKCF